MTETETEGVTDKRLKQEEKAIVKSLHNSFLPQMTSREASLFSAAVADLWPNNDISVTVCGDDEGTVILY